MISDGAIHITYRLMLAGTLFIATTSSQSQVLLRDDFDGGSLNTTLWRLPDPGPGSFLGRTQLETTAQPAISGGTATLRLDTYNPAAPGALFRGSEIISNPRYSRNNGLIFETRSRLVAPTAGGLIGSLFSYDVFGDIRDEIDFELLSNDVVNNTNRVLTNVFQDDPFTGPGSGGDSAFVTVPGIDLTQFNTYRIEWLPDRLDWYINGALVRRATNDLPDDPMSIRLNLWAPDAGFASAFNSALQPASNPAQNQSYFYEVDYVEISRPGTGTPGFDNAGFEDAGGSTAGWTVFGNEIGNVSVQPGTVLEGSQALKLFGQFSNEENYSGVAQGIAVSGGDTVRADASSFIRSQDSIAGTGNTVEMKIEFYDVFDGVINTSSFLGQEVLEIVNGSSLEDAWLDHEIVATAPANAVEARLSFVFIQPVPNAGGAVFIDQTSLVVVETLPADLSGDGDIDDEDLGLFFSAFTGPDLSQGPLTNPAADLSGDGDVDDEDLGGAFGAFTGPLSPINVPEPASAAAVLLGLGLARRPRGTSR